MANPYFYTWATQNLVTPMEFTRSSGSKFWVKTTGGEDEWIDFVSISYQANLGHGHKRMLDRIRKAADNVLIVPPNAKYPVKDSVANKLLAKAPPGFSKVFFTVGGAEATDNAIKIAKMVTGRHKFVSRYRSYHGATIGALSLSGDYRRPPFEPAMAGVVHVLDQYESRLVGGGTDVVGGGPADAIAKIIHMEGGNTIAAMFVEPVPGANGCLVPPKGYLEALRKICDQHGILLVFDCVLNGFLRLGSYYGFEEWGAIPDMILVSKGITAGYAPLGAVLVNDRIAKHFDDKMLYAGLTYYAHPLAMDVAEEALAIYDDEDISTKVKQSAAQFSEQIASIQDRFGVVGGVSKIPRTRAKGLLGAFELTLSPDEMNRLEKALNHERVLVQLNRKNDCLIIAPPLTSTSSEITDGFLRIERAFAAALSVTP